MTDQTSSNGSSGWALDGFLTVALILVVAGSLLMSVLLFVPR